MMLMLEWLEILRLHQINRGCRPLFMSKFCKTDFICKHNRLTPDPTLSLPYTRILKWEMYVRAIPIVGARHRNPRNEEKLL
jgi:hypothetical protein